MSPFDPKYFGTILFFILKKFLNLLLSVHVSLGFCRFMCFIFLNKRYDWNEHQSGVIVPGLTKNLGLMKVRS